MAKTKAQREAEERLRKNNERIYRETGYDPDGWRERTAEIARTERNFAQPSRPKKQKNFTYLKNTKRNAQDRERNIDPYTWQNRDYGTQKDDDGFRWDFGLTGLFGMLAEKKKREEEKADKADPTKSGQYTQAKQEIMKPFEEKVSRAEQEEEAARKEADTLENLIFTKAKGYGTGAGQGYAAAQNNVFASEEEKTENAARLTSALAGQSGKTQEAEQKAADAKGKGAATAAAKALRDQAEKQVDKEIYTIDIQNDAKREEYTQKGREADSKLKKELSKEYVDRVREFGFNADDSKLAYYMINKEEADTYFALNGKYGEEVANRYLDSLMPDLEKRAAQAIYENVEGIDNEALKKIARWGVTVEGAGQNVRRNFMNLPASVTGSDEVAAPGVFQQAQGKIGENLEGIEKVVNDATDSFLNMAPSLALGFIPGVGPAAAAGMTAATSYSNAYTDAILSGYEPGQAAAYALPSAASEALMQYAIGGVAKMGGSKSLTNTVQKAMDDVIKNPAARNVLGKAAQAGGEALEEYLQANLDPVLRNLALGENNEIDPVSEDKAYAALLGAVMGGAIDAVGDAANIPARRSAQRAQDAAYVRQGVHEALNDPIVEQEVRIPTRREAGALDVTDAGNRIRYEQEIDGVFNGELPTHEEIIMGRTPELLTLYGAPDLPLHMTQATARKIAYPEGYQGGRHNLGIQALKELPEQLSDPVAILESKTQPDSHVVLTEWNDTNGDRVIVPIHFNKNGALKINTNEIVSAYGKGNISALMGKNNENVIYTRNNENIADLLAHGLQLPEPQVSSDFSTYNIPRSGNGVNRQYSAKMNADEMLDRIGTQRAYNPSETVKLASGTEAVVVARDGGSYVVQEPGKQGYSRVSADSIIGKVQSASPQADRSIAPEARAALNEKYDHRHVEKLADQAFLDKLEQGRGIKAVIEDMQPGAEAFYDRSTNTIHFAPDSTRADVIGGVAAHELSHAAEASEHYKAYSDYALQRLFGNDAEALQQAIEAKQEQYVRHGVYLSDADAMAEIVADYTRNLYKSPADIDALVTGNRGMAQSIYDAIRTAIQKIRAFFKGDEAALRNIREYQDLRRAQRLFERALSTIPEVQAEAAPAYAVSDVEIPTRREAGMIDITDTGNRIRYEREIDGVFDGSLPTGSEIIMGRTPEILTLYGAPDLPLHMTQATVRKIAYPEGYHGGKHNLGIQAVKDLPDQLVDPIAILINKSHPNNSVVVISEWNDVDGNRVIVPIQFNRQGAITVQNQITSAFGREDMSQYLGKDNENVIYTKNNEDIQSLLSHGRQLPEASRDDVFVTDIIPQTEEDVNRQYSVREDGTSLDDLKKQRSEMIRQAREATDQGIADQTDISSVIGAERAVADERLRQQKAAYEERTARDRMRRKESGERSQLLNIVRRLDKLSKKSAPEQKNAIQNLIKDIDKTAKGITRKGTLTLKAIKAGYEEAAQDLNFIENPAIEKKIARLDQKHIADMDISDVRELTDILRGVEHDIRSANREVGIRKAKVISELSEKGISEIRNSRGASGNAFLSLFNSSSLSPTRRFAQMGGWREGSVMEYLGEQLAEGQRKTMEFRRDASGKFQDFIGQNGKVFDDWSGKKAKWIDTGLSKNGKMLQITPAMRISLYLHSLNADNMRHIAGGGITVPDQKLYKQGKIADAYAHKTVVKLTPQEVKAITDRMTPQEKEFADLAYEFFNTDSKKAINSASLDVLGYEIANVENYMPITADKAFTKGEFESLVKDGTLEGMGMLKERENASNPILLEDITSIIPRHMENAARYYGLAAPIRNFNAVYRRTMAGPDGINDSVQNAIGNKFGKKGTEYIEKLMTDLQGGGRSTDTAFDKMRGKFAQAILGFNAGSALKQTASLPTAASTLGFKAVLGSMRGRVDSARIDANTPLLWERRQGGSTLEIGDVARNRNWEDKVPFLMKWNQSMDVAIAKRLWRAAEIYVNDHYKSLERGSAEYDAEVARWYNKAIEDTQSNYATMQRPGILRSESQSVKALTMFTTDRFQMYNILYEAGGRLRTAKEDYKADPNAENRAAVKKYAQQLARSVAAVTASNAWVAAVTIGINLLLGRQDRYEDEEGDLALAESFGSEFLRNMAGTLPFGDQIYSLIASAVSDETWYGVEAPNIGMINDLAEDVINMAKSISDGGDAAIRRNAKALAMDAAKFFGIPAENIEKYVLGIAGQVAPAVKESYDNIFYPNDLGDLAETEGREYDAVYDTVITNRMNGIKGTDAYEEIKDLYRAMGKGTDRNSMFLPAVPDKVEYTPAGGEKAEYELTAEEQKQYAETQNKVFADAVNALISSKDYVKLDNEQKGYAVSVIADMAKDDAKAEVLGTKGVTMERSRTAILKPEDIALYKAVVMDYGAEGKTAQDERNALLQLDIPEERKAEVYRAVFENQNTEQNGIMRARGQGVGTETYIAFMAQPFWNDETRDDSAGGENLQAKQWLLDNAAEEEIVPLYEMKLESKDTDERSTIAYAQEQGVRPSAFVKREIQKAGERGLPGAPEEDAIWEDGKIVVDEHGTTESGTKKAQACANLLNSGYTEEEKEFFYQKQYSTDDNFPYYAAAGLPVDDYLSVKGYTATLKADKDENGKSISGSKKQKLMDFLEGSDMSEEQKLFFFAQEYKISGAEAQVVRDYINGLDTTDDVKEKLLASVKLGGSSGGSSGGRRRSGGSSKAASQAIPDSVWNTLRSNVKAPGVPDNPVFAALLSMAEEHDSIMRAAMERDIAAVEANPFISNEAKAAQKKKIRERYGKGAVS